MCNPKGNIWPQEGNILKICSYVLIFNAHACVIIKIIYGYNFYTLQFFDHV